MEIKVPNLLIVFLDDMVMIMIARFCMNDHQKGFGLEVATSLILLVRCLSGFCDNFVGFKQSGYDTSITRWSYITTITSLDLDLS